MQVGASRTGTARWKALRQQALREATSRGVTNCPLCGTILDYTQGRHPTSAEVDHIIPHSLGGQDTLDNVRVICRRCNQSRGNRTETTTSPSTSTTLIGW